MYLVKHNPHWKEEYELITSNSGFERHLIPVSELKAINDVTSRGQKFTTKDIKEDFDKMLGLIDGLIEEKIQNDRTSAN